MNKKPNYETPEILPGDLIECLKTGGKGIIRECGDPMDTRWAIALLPGARIKSAWWSRDEFKVLQKGPAHPFWAEAMQAQKQQDEECDRERDPDWVIANWKEIRVNPSLTAVTTILQVAGCLPDHTGYLMRGEIGLEALAKFEHYARLAPFVELAMTQEDPVQALAEIGRTLQTTRPTKP